MMKKAPRPKFKIKRIETLDHQTLEDSVASRCRVTIPGFKACGGFVDSDKLPRLLGYSAAALPPCPGPSLESPGIFSPQCGNRSPAP